MRTNDLIPGIKSVYNKTTILEGTIHFIKGSWKMTKVFLISLYWRYNFRKTGRNLSIFPKTKIEFPKNISVGDNFHINLYSYLRSENDKGEFKAGNNVCMGQYILFDYSGGVDIGDNVVISDYTHIHSHSHGLNPWGKPIFKKLTIEKNVWIGDGALILYQVSKIGKGSIIGARSVVTKDVPPYTIVAGNPAKVIKELKKD